MSALVPNPAIESLTAMHCFCGQATWQWCNTCDLDLDCPTHRRCPIHPAEPEPQVFDIDALEVVSPDAEPSDDGSSCPRGHKHCAGTPWLPDSPACEVCHYSWEEEARAAIAQATATGILALAGLGASARSHHAASS